MGTVIIPVMYCDLLYCDISDVLSSHVEFITLSFKP